MPAAKKKTDIPSNLQKGLGYIAKGLGVAVEQLWTMFVQQYFVRGIAMGVITLLSMTLVVMRYGPFFWEHMNPLVASVLIAVKLFALYWSIMYIGNPKYYALNDLTDKVSDVMKTMKEGGKEVEVLDKKSLSRSTYY